MAWTKGGNWKSTPLAEEVDLSETEIDVEDASALPAANTLLVMFGAAYSTPFADPGREIVLLTDKVGNTITVTRGLYGTSASEHHIGDRIANLVLWEYIDELHTAVDNHTHDGTEQNGPELPFTPLTTFDDLGRFGFLNQTETTLSFNDTTYEVTLADAGGGWSYFRSGLKYTITGNKSVRLVTSPGTPVDGTMYYIYINGTDGALSVSTDPWTLNDTLVPVCTVKWNSSLTPKYLLSEERHSCLIDRRQHRKDHFTEGTQLISGGALSGTYTTDTDTDAAKAFGISETVIADEDLFSTLSEIAEPDGATSVYPVIYRTGATAWAWALSDMPFRYTAAGYIQYDNAGSMTEGAGNKYYNTWIVASNIQGTYRFAIVHGRAAYSTTAAAYGEAFPNIAAGGFPTIELVAFYQLTWSTSAGYSSKGKCVLNRAAVIVSNPISAGATGTVPHNATASKQGGTTDEYYHLTATEWGYLLGQNQALKTTDSPYFVNTLLEAQGRVRAAIFQSVADPSLVKALWMFDQTGAVATCNDYSAGNHTLDLSANANTLSPGVIGSSRFLTLTSGAYFDSVDHDDFSVAGPTPFTIIWAGQLTDATSSTLLAKYSDLTGDTKREWIFGTNSDDKIGFNVYDNDTTGNVGRTYNTAITADQNTFAVYVARFSGGTTNGAVTIWRNGVQIDDTDAGSGTYTDSANFAAKVASYYLPADGTTKTNVCKGKPAVVCFIKGEALTPLAIKRISDALLTYGGTSPSQYAASGYLNAAYSDGIGNFYANTLVLTDAALSRGAANRLDVGASGSVDDLLVWGKLAVGMAPVAGCLDYLVPTGLTAARVAIRLTDETVNSSCNFQAIIGSGAAADANVLGAIRWTVTQADPSALKASSEWRVNTGDSVATGITLGSDLSATFAGDIILPASGQIQLNKTLSADGKYSGLTVTGIAGATLAFGDLVYKDPTDSRWELVDANSAAGADGDPRGILGICVRAAAADGDATTVLLYGFVRADTAFPTFTINNPVYISETAGDVTQTQPTTSGVVIRVVGVGFTADGLFFAPSPDYITKT